MVDNDAQTNAINQKITDQMEKMGIKIANVSVYPSHIGMEKFSTSIIVGYLSDKACIFNVKISSGNPHSMKFVINGQLNVDKKSRNLFTDFIRNPTGSEDHGYKFDINHETSNKTNEERISSGIGFFADFFKKYEKLLESKFTEHIFLWFVPEYSDEYQKSQSHLPFNQRVKNKLPQGYLVENE